MELGTFSISLAVKDIEASRGFLRKVWLQSLRRRCLAELVNSKERRSRNRSFSGHVRKKHHDLQSGLGQQRKQPRDIHRRS